MKEAQLPMRFLNRFDSRSKTLYLRPPPSAQKASDRPATVAVGIGCRSRTEALDLGSKTELLVRLGACRWQLGIHDFVFEGVVKVGDVCGRVLRRGVGVAGDCQMAVGISRVDAGIVRLRARVILAFRVSAFGWR